MSSNDTSVILEGLHYSDGYPIRVTIEGGAIARLDRVPLNGRTGLPRIGPGLVDLQINGYNGLDFNTLPFQTELVHQVSRELFREGYTAYYPTVITNSEEEIGDAVRTIARACREDALTASTIAGIHVEGPFISPEDGARGAHARQFVQAPDWDMFQRWQEAADGRIKILTISPEWEPSIPFIRRCADSGVTVSIGHTSATPEQVREAVDAGATMSTHFGNGSHLMIPRHPNYLWEQLAQDNLWCCLIADGFHLPEQVLKVAMRVKGRRALLVSDAVYLSGMPAGEYKTHVGGQVVLTPEGRLHTAANEKVLAGSAQMLIWGIEHVVRRGLVGIGEAWDMSSIRPAEFMGLRAKSGLAVGAPADLTVFGWDGDRVQLQQTFKAGVQVYDRAKEN
ncbi:N-acetylglucosamine-6-phosphate deacetylase [Paenibacillus koleovorans]|uniref:N-acetylglucosamine-6-phosphate deacetylase n=1 Tax=Paenibacillus koleovorans TaxID=121608 RepID=UPI000FDBA4FA|nr:amidohydrolase family protein [Paenibacillus koleovorans]